MISSHLGLITLIIYSFFISFTQSFYISMILPFIWIILSLKKDFILYLKKLFFLNIFIAIIIFSLIISNEYDKALLIFLRSNALISMALYLFWKQNVFSISQGFQTLRIHPKFTSLFFFSAKFIILIRKEFETFKKTLKTRGFKATTSVFTYKTYANFIGMLIIKSFKRAKRLEDAMMLRGFEGKLYTLHVKKSLHINEILFILIVILSLVLRIGVII